MHSKRAGLSQALLLLAFAVGCSSSGSESDVDAASDSTYSGGSCDAAAFVGCCCQGDVTAPPICTAAGTFACPSGFGSYAGDDCRCLPDRETPCCLPHLHDSGVPDARETGVDADAAAETESGGDACASIDAGDLCCCEGDVVAMPVCGETGAATCPSGFSAYHGADCIRPCGPCSLPCFDTGPG